MAATRQGAAANTALLQRLVAALGTASGQVREQAERSLARLAVRSAPRQPEDLQILLPFGGGKDSAWTLAYLRLMQLLLVSRTGRCFGLHVLFMVHPGMPLGVFDNVVAVLQALEIPGAPEMRVFTTTLGGEEIALGSGTIGDDLVARFREEVLISGHLAQGNGRETFCNGCNFTLMNAIARYVVNAAGALDYVVTGDSRSEVASYWRWVQRTAAGFALPPMTRRDASWPAVFGKLAEISASYYDSLLGAGAAAADPYAFPHVGRQGIHPPEYFGVFEEASYEYWTHQEFMEGFLGFKLREDAFNFTESDCRNPMLMAHLRGLLADFEGRGYCRGVREYLQLVTHLMARKAYSEEMIEMALAPYHDDAAIERRRELAEAHALGQYRITPLQLRALVASPLTDDLARLDRFLAWACPEALPLAPALRGHLRRVREAGAAAANAATEAPGPVRRLVDGAFGLSPGGLALLLGRSTVSGAAGTGCSASELEILRAGDPHQMELGVSGQQANRIITGR